VNTRAWHHEPMSRCPLPARFRRGFGLVAVLLGACTRPASEPPPAPPPPAAAPAPAAPISYGNAMADVARRFELLGRAAVAGRFELADYQLGELGEQFEDTLPHASLPREGHPEVLPAISSAFVHTNLPELQRALASRDHAAVLAAFERTARACNGCHRASGHGFIEIPLVAGRSVPNTDPVTP
jgi:hypothetical protein